MNDWIVGLEKAAARRDPGLGGAELASAAQQLGFELPEEVQNLYGQFNGAYFSSGVELWPLIGTGSVLERSQEPISGLSATGSFLRLGSRAGRQLFGAQKDGLTLVSEPSWWADIPGEAFVFGWRDEAGEQKLYRTLEHLLATLIPPAETEEFGERTYARAMSIVQGALDSIRGGAGSVAEKASGVGPEIAAKAKQAIDSIAERIRAARNKRAKASPKAKPEATARKSKPAAKKAKAPARKKPAKAAPKPAAKKKAAAKKPAKRK